MKCITIFLLLIFISCKSEPEGKTKTEAIAELEATFETENRIDTSVNEMWRSFIKLNPKFNEDNMPKPDFFHNNRDDANRLAELTLNGKKTASSSLYYLYKKYKVDLPKVGNKQIITDFDGKAKAIIITRKVDTIPFNEISEDYAKMDMGTDIEALNKWRKAHGEFFKNFIKEIGEKPIENMLVVCERFETIWPK